MERNLFIINNYTNKVPDLDTFSKEVETVLDGGVRFAYIGGVNDYKGAIRQAGESGEDIRVFACGGDGTLNSVIQEVIGFDNLSVTNFALGTGNDYLKRFDDPTKFRDIREFSDVRESKVDIVRLNDMYSANVVCYGLDARVCKTYEKLRRYRLLRRIGYHIGCVISIIKGITQGCTIELDDGYRYDGKLTLMCVCNNGWYGGSYHPAPEANVKDGYLEVIICKAISRLTMIRIIGKYKKGRRDEISRDIISCHRVRSLRVTSHGVAPFNLDGELVDLEDAEIEVLPQRMRFFYPASVKEIDP